MAIRCGNRKAHGQIEAHHETVAQVRLCYARGEQGIPSIQDEIDAARDYHEFDADAAYERFLETRYSAEIAWEESREEALRGFPGY